MSCADSTPRSDRGFSAASRATCASGCAPSSARLPRKAEPLPHARRSRRIGAGRARAGWSCCATAGFLRASTTTTSAVFCDRMGERALADGELVFAAGAPGDALCVVAEGAIEVTANATLGACASGVLGPGRCSAKSRSSMVARAARPARRWATRCVLELSAEAFAALAEADSPLSLQILEALIANLIAARQRLNRARGPLAAEPRRASAARPMSRRPARSFRRPLRRRRRSATR